MKRSIVMLVMTAVLGGCRTAPDVEGGWLRWGGPGGDFVVATDGLADSWDETPPKTLWRRPLGEGYASIVVDGESIYTLYRKNDRDIVVALDRKTGDTRWEYGYDAPIPESMGLENGAGPHSTPVLVGDRLFTVGATGILHGIDKKTGERLWVRKVTEEFGGNALFRGYSASPLVYGDTVIVPVGGKGQGVVAFSQEDGSIAWQSQDFDISHSTPIIADVAGQDQLIIFASEGIFGVDPRNGDLFWREPHHTIGGHIVPSPVFGEDSLLFVSCAYDGDSRCFRLARNGDRTTTEKLWETRQLRVHHSNSMRIGDYVYGPHGDFGPKIFTAVDIKTGDVVWRDRRLERVNTIFVDGKLVALDEKGTLYLTTVSSNGLTILSKLVLFNDRAWTPPTLVGKTIFARNRKEVVALELP